MNIKNSTYLGVKNIIKNNSKLVKEVYTIVSTVMDNLKEKHTNIVKNNVY